MVRAAILAACVAFTWSEASAQSNRDSIDEIQSNLWVFHYVDGEVVVDLMEDGSFSASNGFSGEWTFSDGRFCAFYGEGETGCILIAPGKVLGDRWTLTDMFGQAVDVEIRKRTGN